MKPTPGVSEVTAAEHNGPILAPVLAQGACNRIIDNRTERLVDHLNQILGTSERARFAVGYLFLSGLTSVAKRLLNLKELRLLIGNTTNRETVEMVAEGYRRIDLAAG